MSLIKKSDVKHYLSTRSAKPLPLGLTRRVAAANAERKPSGMRVNAPAISISPSYPISPEPVPNAQVGGPVGVPEGTERSGSPRW